MLLITLHPEALEGDNYIQNLVIDGRLDLALVKLNGVAQFSGAPLTMSCGPDPRVQSSRSLAVTCRLFL